MKIYAPANGKVIPLNKLPDEAFAGGFLGDGLAVIPDSGMVYSPCDGRIVSVHSARHAATIESDGIRILCHIGIDTVMLGGRGFKSHVKAGDTVRRGDLILSFDRKILEKEGKCDYLIITSPDKNTRVENRADGYIRLEDELFTVISEQDKSSVAEKASGTSYGKAELILLNANGLHARPAAVIAGIAEKHKTEKTIISYNGREADATSIVELMGLGVACGGKITVSVSGPEATTALNDITEAVNSGLGETVVQTTQNTDIPASGTDSQDKDGLSTVVSSLSEIQEEQKNISAPGTRLKGIPVCPTPAYGRAVILKRTSFTYDKNSTLSAAEEKKRLACAVEKVNKDLRQLICGIKNSRSGNIFEAHLQMLSDPHLITGADRMIEKGYTAEYAFSAAVNESVNILLSSGTDIVRQRQADYRQLLNKVLAALCGVCVRQSFERGSIIITDELLPGETDIEDENIAGFISAAGSPSSHSTIILKNAGIPFIMSAGKEILSLREGSEIFLNMTPGEILINPPRQSEIAEEYKKKKEILHSAFEKRFEPAITVDGIKITVSGNAGTPEDAVAAAGNGAEGIGLLRTEFLFSGADRAPSEDEQTALYSSIADTQKGNTVTIRLLDGGNDKNLKFLSIPEEKNPALGLRGIRVMQLDWDIFRTQVRAVLRVNPEGVVRIMLPMITFPEEFTFCRNIIREEQEKLGIKEVQTGIMLEVPAAALMADKFTDADFFSLGTNDLTQYALAMDRTENRYAEFSDGLNPAVLKIIRTAVDAAEKSGRSIGICGTMASDYTAVPVLIGLGLRSLAVTSAEIPMIKELIRGISMADCRLLAEKALSAENAAAVRALAEEFTATAHNKIPDSVVQNKSAVVKIQSRSTGVKATPTIKKLLTRTGSFFSELGKSLMLPIALLPVAGLLNRLGQKDLFDIPFIAKAGGALFDNLPLIFALGTATGFAKGSHGAAALSAFAGYIILTASLKTLNPDLDLGVMGGILAGVMAGKLYNSFKDTKLPPYLAFFGGRRFVPVITGAASLALAALFSIIWPPAQNAISAFGSWITGSGNTGLFLYGMANRLLIPLGLHHVLNTFIWFQSGDFINPVTQTVTHGDLWRFFAGDPDAGSFMAGFFPVMMFGLPAAALAMTAEARPGQKKQAAGILFSAALTAFLTGITEPLEFAFMFLAFPLYVCHAVFTGLSLVIMNILDVRIGFTFSAGLFDYLLNYGISSNPLYLLPVGMAYALVYYVIFRIVIRKFNLPTPGRGEVEAQPAGKTAPSGMTVSGTTAESQKEADISAEGNTTTAGTSRLSEGEKWLKALGGKENITGIGACATRLRLELISRQQLNDTELKALGARGIISGIEGTAQIIIGPEADILCDKIKEAMGE